MAENKPTVIDVREFKGLNTLDDPIALDPSESPYIVNMDITKSAAMISRFGYELVGTIGGGVTGATRGIMSYYRTYGTGSGDYLIVHHNDGNSYYVTNSNYTPTSIGSYGTDNGIVRGIVFNNLAIYGNGLAANSVKKWDGTTLANLGGSPKDCTVFGTFGKRLWTNDTAAPSAIYYSDVDNPESGIGTNVINVNIGDGQDVSGFINNNDSLQIYKEDSVYAVNFSFDSSYNMTIPQLQPIVSANTGVYATGSLAGVFGYSYYLAKNGFNSYGPSPQRIVADQPLPLSLKIDPTIKGINWAYKANINAVFSDNKYICSVPLNNSSTNDYCFVYNENVKRRFGIDNWTMYKGIPALQFAVFRDSNKRDQLYFCSNTEPKIYRFNTSFSDNGFGYDRIWRSKSFQFGEITKWKFLYLEGSKVRGSTIFVQLNTDSLDSTPIKITDTNFVVNGSGGYIGSNYVGDEYVGGGSGQSTATPMFKWRKRIRIPDTINLGNTFYFTIYNNKDGEGWMLSRFRLTAIPQPEEFTYNNVEN